MTDFKNCLIRVINLYPLFILAIVPLLPYKLNFGFEQIKVLFFIVSLTIYLVFFEAAIYFKIITLKLSWSKIQIFSLIFLLVLFTSTIFGINPQVSLFGKGPYFQGFIFYLYLILFALLITNLKFKLKQIAIVITLSGLYVSTLAIKDFIAMNIFHQVVLTYSGKVISTFGQSSLYAGFLAINLPFCFYLFQNKDRKIKAFGILGLIIFIMAILISYSRAAIAILVSLACFYLLQKLNKKLRSAVIILGLTVFLAVLFFSYKLQTGVLWKEVFEPKNTLWLEFHSPEKRVLIWDIMFKQVLSKPFLGYGLENIDLTYANFFKSLDFNQVKEPAFYSLRDLVVNRAHSYPFDLLLYSGIIGLGVWLLLIWQAIKKAEGTVLMSMIAFLIWSGVQIPSAVHLIYFWFLIGLASQRENI